MNKYKRAVMNCTQFQTAKGIIVVQDLFRIPLSGTGSVNLNAIGTKLKQDIKANEDALIVGDGSTEMAFQLSIVKDVIETRQAIAAARSEDRVKAKRKADLTKALEVKRMGNLEAMSEEDMLAELAKL